MPCDCSMPEIRVSFKMSFACIDFETANHKRSSACQLGVAIVSDGKITQSRSWLVKPEPFQFEPICTSKHGIKPEEVADCPRFDELWPSIHKYIGSARLVAHNARFDMSVLSQVLGVYGCAVPETEYLCTLQMARALWRYPSYSLPFLASTFEIDLQHHDALSDAEACAHVLIRGMAEVGTVDSEEFVKLSPLGVGILGSQWKCEGPKAASGLKQTKSIAKFYSGRLADLQGKTISTTGALGRGLTRVNFVELVEEAGGKFHPSPRKTTQLFVVGSNDASSLAKNQSLTSKHRKALELFENESGIEIISADDFLDMLILPEESPTKD